MVKCVSLCRTIAWAPNCSFADTLWMSSTIFYGISLWNLELMVPKNIVCFKIWQWCWVPNVGHMYILCWTPVFIHNLHCRLKHSYSNVHSGIIIAVICMSLQLQNTLAHIVLSSEYLHLVNCTACTPVIWLCRSLIKVNNTKCLWLSFTVLLFHLDNFGVTLSRCIDEFILIGTFQIILLFLKNVNDVWNEMLSPVNCFS